MFGKYEFQMQYGSIGWSVGATLGYAQAMPEKRLISCIGDGSFQVTVQDVSTMIRNGQNPIIFLINNGGYTIEVEIHDGPYNVIKNWNYTGLVDAIHNGQGKCWTAKVKTEEEAVEAIKTALGPKRIAYASLKLLYTRMIQAKSCLSGVPESRQQTVGRQILNREALKRLAIGNTFLCLMSEMSFFLWSGL